MRDQCEAESSRGEASCDMSRDTIAAKLIRLNSVEDHFVYVED